MRHRFSTLISVVPLTLPAGPSIASPILTLTPVLGDYSSARGVTASMHSGAVVATNSRDQGEPLDQASIWTPAGGVQSLGVLPQYLRSVPSGITGDGTVIVGTAQDPISPAPQRAFRWTPSGGIALLPLLTGTTQSSAAAVSQDGSVIAGSSAGNGNGRAVRWTGGGETVTPLQPLPGRTLSSAVGVSGDGSLVIGQSLLADGTGRVPTAWLADGTAIDITPPGTTGATFVLRESANATVLIQASLGGAQGMQVYTWTQASGFTFVPGLRNVQAISDDGQVILGFSDLLNDPPGGGRAIWTQQFGIQSFNGVLLAAGFSRTDAYALTPAGFAVGSTVDNLIVVGSASNPSQQLTAAFITDMPVVPSPSTAVVLGIAATGVCTRRRRAAGVAP